MIRKLRQNKGETLIEALLALLIAVLAIGLVATAALAAANINQSTRAADAAFAEELEEAEIYAVKDTEKQLIIEYDTEIDGIKKVKTEVEVYGEGSLFASYK